jgi:hypothetical protein
MPEQKDFLCSICFKTVNLKRCKRDELGRPVHEDCYEKWLLHMPQKRPYNEGDSCETWGLE